MFVMTLWTAEFKSLKISWSKALSAIAPWVPLAAASKKALTDQTAFSSPFITAGSTAAGSKGFPGTIPNPPSFFTMGASAGAGGLSFISSANRPKKVAASILATWVTGGVFTSTDGSAEPKPGGVYGLP